VRTRRYHALLLPATTPPTGRVALVNGVDAWIETPAGRFALSTQRYAPGVLHPDGMTRIATFAGEPWPTWTFVVPDGVRVTQELFVEHGVGTAVLKWSIAGPATGARLVVRPFLSGRDYHSMHRENGAFCFDAERRGAATVFRPYPGVPAVTFLSDGEYRHEPEWYRNFLYSAETERGLDDREDLGSPGVFEWTLDGWTGEAVMMIVPGDSRWPGIRTGGDAAAEATRICDVERRRRAAFATPQDRAADTYLVRRGRGLTVVAGYPWFTDWGRDTFIAVRGLCLATGLAPEARDILVEWAGAVSEGMLPNRFPDGGDIPEFNSVDASLWYVVAVGELLALAARQPSLVGAADRRTLELAVGRIVAGYAAGTRFGIRMDADSLLAAGVPGSQLTWMDARVGDRVITPRIGKPVEIQALWINALSVASQHDSRWADVQQQALRSFAGQFWNEDAGFLADVIDVDHERGRRDDTFRPNQIFAVGGLPVALIEGSRASRVVAAVEQRLLTPLGLRSLAPGEAGYAARYEGDGAARAAVYHQGTIWPWLMGAFVEAWVRVRGTTAAARREARQRFVEPMRLHFDDAGLGHISEIADAEPPFAPRGCPFQAWSLGEWLRLDRAVLRRRVTAPGISPARM
jgi:predicted glycogen debranching enzyme